MVQQLEEKRRVEMKKFMLISAGILIVSFLVMLVFSNRGLFGAFLFLVMMDIVAIALVYQSMKKKYGLAYKEICLKEMLSKEFDDLRVDFEHGFSEDQIREGHLVTLYDRFYSDDYISAKLNGIPFECSDIHVQDVVRSGKTTTVVTRFQGFYLKVPLKKVFRSWIVVREKEFLDNGNPRGWFSDMPELERFSMEDEQFNQKFSVYASNGAEAFYLLTPRFLEEIKHIEACYEGRCLFGFLNGNLHVAIDSRKDHFDISLFEKADEIKLNEHHQQIQMIKGIIECVRKECEEA